MVVNARLRALLAIATGLAALLSATAFAGSMGIGDLSKPLVVDITHDPNHLNGGDALAVNPRNPNNLVYVGLKHTPPAGSFPPPSIIPVSPTGTQTYNCFVAHSMNRGRTWTVEPWPNDGYPSCGITTVAVSSGGTFYICANQLGSRSGAGTGNGAIDNSTNHPGVVMSTDGGRTWQKPTNPPLSAEAHPKLRIDSVTGKLYVISPLAGINGSPYVTVSADKAKTWTDPVAFPNNNDHIAVHAGLLATAGFPSGGGGNIKGFGGSDTGIPAPGGQQGGGAVTFSLSRDDGQSFTTTSVTDGQGHAIKIGNVDGGTPDPAPWVTADPTKTGRFALMQWRVGRYEVYVTNDAGAHWNGPALIPAPGASYGWIEYGLGGALAVMWRKYSGDVEGSGENGGTLDAYAALSLNHGLRFSKPYRLTPRSVPDGAWYGDQRGDDYSWVTADTRFVYAGWPDGRSGGIGDAIFARVPFSVFDFH